MFSRLKRFADGRSQRRWSKTDISVEYEVLGSDYGGWPVAVSDVGPGTTVFSFGAGADISFDLAAIERFGCNVWVFDPTPKSVAWIKGLNLPEQLMFHPIGIDQADGEVQLYSPPDPEHVSFAINPAPSAEGQFSITANVMRLESIVSHLACALPDILKLDVEGFEYRVIADILSGPIRPAQLLVEFHHGKYGFDISDTARSVASLKNAGYRIFHVSQSGREYGFIRP
ncbi:FkbM family methyltransferase [Anderseniella sp. Alg231-50]|uniref:FkbM family methyltransferase n=1 Tax=Anderseniella sp. Alg231-50 TaxID=1922226 RepID=UPI00307B1513